MIRPNGYKLESFKPNKSNVVNFFDLSICDLCLNYEAQQKNCCTRTTGSYICNVHARDNTIDIYIQVLNYIYMYFAFVNCNTKRYSIKSSFINKGNNKITELRAILQRESQNS